MEIYILDKKNLETLSVEKLSTYEINVDEETNSKSVFTLVYTQALRKYNYIVVNGLYKQFLFIIENVEKDKNSNKATVTALDISNIFDRKIIEKNINIMTTNGLEDFIANAIAENFVLSSDTVLNINYIDIYIHSHTKKNEKTNSKDYLYNLHTFITNCRQNSNIYTDFKFENNRLRIDIENKNDQSITNIDTTLPEIIDYKKIYEQKVTSKVECYCRDTQNVYNLYLKTDRTTTTNKDDINRADGNVETISIEKEEEAYNECLKIIRNNLYKHLVEFKIAKTSKLIDVTKLKIGTKINIKTDKDIYSSYISAIALSDDNFVRFKTGNVRARTA